MSRIQYEYEPEDTPQVYHSLRDLNDAMTDFRIPTFADPVRCPGCDDWDCADCNRVTASTLQREVRIRGTGGGGGAGRQKPIKPIKNAYAPVEGNEPEKTTRMQVPGLTPGERDYYLRRPGDARDVLRSHARQFEVAPKSVERIEHLSTADRRKSFVIYGLTEIEIEILRLVPGRARQILSDYARAKAGERIKQIDGPPKEKPPGGKATPEG